MMLIAVLLPFIIATFQEYLHKREESKPNYAAIDKRIYIKYVLWNWWFILPFFILLLPKIIMTSFDSQSLPLFIFSLMIFTSGLFLGILVYYRLITWIRGKRIQFRIKYIKNAKKVEDIKFFFNELWDISDIIGEGDFLNLFSRKIQKLYQIENYDNVTHLLTKFNSRMSKRFLYAVINSLMDKLIKLGEGSFDDRKTHSMKTQVVVFLNTLFTLVKEDINLILYFSVFEKAMHELEDSEYRRFLYRNFIQSFLNKIDKRNLRRIEFPKAFIVNRENIKKVSKNRIFAFQTIFEFYGYSMDNILFAESEEKHWEFRVLVDCLTDCLDGYTLLIHFYITGLFGVDGVDIKGLLNIDHFPQSGGVIKKCGDRIPMQPIDNPDELDEIILERIMYTVDLIEFVKSEAQNDNIFTIFTQENYQKWVNELKAINDNDLDKKGISRRDKIVKRFETIIDYLDKKEQNDDKK
ncbi:hypothetical protein KAU32_10375 [bacterium]|nr:hypothetical protein [bacterium]